MANSDSVSKAIQDTLEELLSMDTQELIEVFNNHEPGFFAEALRESGAIAIRDREFSGSEVEGIEVPLDAYPTKSSNETVMKSNTQTPVSSNSNFNLQTDDSDGYEWKWVA